MFKLIAFILKCVFFLVCAATFAFLVVKVEEVLGFRDFLWWLAFLYAFSKLASFGKQDQLSADTTAMLNRLGGRVSDLEHPEFYERDFILL